MILHLKGKKGQTIHEIDTNLVTNYSLPPQGDGIVVLADGKVLVIDSTEFDKLFEAMNAPKRP